MSETRLFTIPSHWCWAPLGEIGEVELGKMLSDKAFEPDLIQLPYLRNQNVRWGSIDYSDVKLMGFKESELARYGLKPGDLLVCEGGEPGRSAIYTREAGEFMYQKALHRIRPYGGLIQPRYLQLCLWNYAMNGLVIPRPSQTTIQHLPRERMLELPIPIAPLSEQERIVAEVETQFSRLGDAVSSLQRVQVKLKRFREAILTAACEGRLVPSEVELARVEEQGYIGSDLLLQGPLKPVERFPNLPEGWIWTNLQQLASPEPNSITDGPFGSNLKTAHYTKDGPRVVRLQNIGDGVFVNEVAHIAPEHYNRLIRHKVEPGDLVIAMLGEKLPRACIVPGWLGPAIVKADCVRFSSNKTVALPEYLNCALNSEGVRARTSALVHGVGRPRLNTREIKEVYVPLPPLAEQRRIVEEVERQFSVVNDLTVLIEQNLLRAGSLRKAILLKAFRGELVLNDSAVESVSVLLDQIREIRENEKEQDSNRRERLRNPTPRRGTGIKPGVSTPGTGTTPTPPKPRRGAGSVQEESAYAPPGLPDDSGASSLGLKPQALCPGPSGAEENRGLVPVPASSMKRKGEEETAFVDLPRDAQIDLVWESLLGRGAIEKEDAIRTMAQSLRDQGRAQFQRFRQGGPLYQAIAMALDRGIRDGSFDRPRRGHVRALLNDPKDYSPDEWRLCLLSSLDHEAVEEDDALRSAAEWGRENLGLEFSRLREDGVILRSLRVALEEAVRQREVRRVRGTIQKLE